MNLTIFGASGGVGRELVAQAVEAGHVVRAVVRSGSAAPLDARVQRRTIDDLCDAVPVSEAVRGADAVLCAVGLRRRHPANPWSKIVSPVNLTSRLAQVLVEVMGREAPGARLVVVSAAGVGDSRARMSGVLRWMFDHSNIGVAYADLEKMESILRRSSLDWMAVRPVTLTHGRRRSRAAVKRHYGLWDRIARADVAWYMLGALNQPALTQRTPMIAG